MFRSSSQIWAELHEKAFRRLGGVTKIVVPDNLREGVLTPDIYDPTLNPLYSDVLRHYSATPLPCRFVRRYLERNSQLPLSLRQVDPLIRELTHYRDLIESKTTESKTKESKE